MLRSDEESRDRMGRGPRRRAPGRRSAACREPLTTTMGIIGAFPEQGVRVVLERPRSGGAPWVYRGEIATSDVRYPVTATLDEDGRVVVEGPADSPTDLEPR